MTLRKAFFWTHLVSGLVAGLVIALLALTGIVLSFEPQIVDWVERDVRRIPAAAADAEKTSIEDLMKFIREEHPDARPSGFTLYSDPRAAIVITAGRGQTYYADPYTTAIKEAGSAGLREFFNFTLTLHRFLALTGEQRAIGGQITGVATFIFLGLSLTGLIIWWPKKWSWRAMKPSVWFIGAKGKLRDWNWHNVIGLWSTPVLILICCTGLLMSYRWVGNVTYVLTGNPIPPTPVRGGGPPGGGPGGGEGEATAMAAATPAASRSEPVAPATATTAAASAPTPAAGELPPVVVPTPPRGARPLAYEPLLAAVFKVYPNWEQVTLRAAGNARQRRPAPPAATASAAGAPAGEGRPSGGERASGGGDRAPRSAAAVSLNLRTTDMWFSTSNLTLSVDPYTGDILRTQSLSDQILPRQLRTLARPLHTGVVIGWPGQLLVALGSLGALFLVYTGVALSWRRFFGKNRKKSSAKTAAKNKTKAKVLTPTAH